VYVRQGRILLKNSENERRQKTRLWLCRADIATRCHRQFATVAAHRKVSFSAETLSAFFLKPACCLKNCDRDKKSSFSTASTPLQTFELTHYRHPAPLAFAASSAMIAASSSINVHRGRRRSLLASRPIRPYVTLRDVRLPALR